MKLTRKYFDIFKKECKKWIEFWKMGDWDVSFAHEHIEGAVANCFTDTESKQCVITLSTVSDPRSNPIGYIKETAFHEVAHLLLADFSGLATDRFITKEEVEAREHEIVNRLQNSVFYR